MPIYEYECECGKKQEEFRPIDKRYEVTCSCGLTPTIKLSMFMGKIVGVHTVVGHDSRVIGTAAKSSRTPMATPSGREY